MCLECIWFWARDPKIRVGDFYLAYQNCKENNVKFPSKNSYFKPENYYE